MHGLSDMEYIEDSAGRGRVKWACECGRTGSGRDVSAAKSGFKRHLMSEYRKGDW